MLLCLLCGWITINIIPGSKLLPQLVVGGGFLAVPIRSRLAICHLSLRICSVVLSLFLAGYEIDDQLCSAECSDFDESIDCYSKIHTRAYIRTYSCLGLIMRAAERQYFWWAVGILYPG